MTKYHYPAKSDGNNYYIRQAGLNRSLYWMFLKFISSDDAEFNCVVGDRIDDCVLPPVDWWQNPTPAYEVTETTTTVSQWTVEYRFWCVWWIDETYTLLPFAGCPEWIMSPDHTDIRVCYEAIYSYYYQRKFEEQGMGCDFAGPPSRFPPGEIRPFHRPDEIITSTDAPEIETYPLDLHPDWSLADAEAEWDIMSEGTEPFPLNYSPFIGEFDVPTPKRNGIFIFATGTKVWDDGGPFTFGPFSGVSRGSCQHVSVNVDPPWIKLNKAGFSISWEDFHRPAIELQYKGEEWLSSSAGKRIFLP